MKEFYVQCMKDLYALTGIEQVRWMLMDLKEGERNFDLCVEGMVKTSELFKYIPDAEQQKIIRKMMVEDKEYTGLNSRTIYKWLSMNKEIYWESQSDYQEITREPAPPEVADKYIEKWLADVAKIGKPTTPVNLNQHQRNNGQTLVTGKEYIEHRKNLVTFICDGFEVPAKDEHYARMSYKELFGKEPDKCELKS